MIIVNAQKLLQGLHAVHVHSVGKCEGPARERITLGRGETSISDSDGSAIFIYAPADDNKTDPAGNSGDRIARGVMTKVAAKREHIVMAQALRRLSL